VVTAKVGLKMVIILVSRMTNERLTVYKTERQDCKIGTVHGGSSKRGEDE
jgi:hypothetical protein